MRRSRRRLLLLIGFLPVLVFSAALLYMAGMAWLEGSPRSFWQSVEWAAETITTTGYGSDSHWSHPAMVLFVMSVQFIGVFLVILIFPVYLIPFLEERFETRLPQEAPAGLEGHAVIYRYGPAVETLLGELATAKMPVLVLEPDEAVARRLFEEGQPVVNRALGEGALRGSRLERARAVIANGTDDENASLILTARQRGFTGPILALVEEPYHRKPMMLAGATATFTPRHILGAALAARASQRISPRVAGIQQLGRNLQVAEVRVGRDSPLAGRTLDVAAVGTRTGATVIGQWVGGELEVLSDSGARIEPGGTLVVVGSNHSIEKLSDLAAGNVALRRDGHFVVGGGGEVGRKVAELLEAVGEGVKLIDRHPGPEVDVVGDVLDMRVLNDAGVCEAQAVILALDTDSATLFATVILKDLAPDVPVIARVNRADNVERIHRAGAYFALSISQVSGQMLAKKLLGEEAFLIDPQLKVLKVSPDGLAGKRPVDLDVRQRTGCSVVAVERGEEVLVEFGPDFLFRPDDTLYVCGSHAAIRRFTEVFQGAA
ncbi:MAG TPA: NAD-binding protein [Thermoanaerobaculia bacterium]|jgi:Trk K+ transport system NAD-binding subunit|nr:NAD-binding protein [Thermoanaerobaculia bacterium]